MIFGILRYATNSTKQRLTQVQGTFGVGLHRSEGCTIGCYACLTLHSHRRLRQVSQRMIHGLLIIAHSPSYCRLSDFTLSSSITFLCMEPESPRCNILCFSTFLGSSSGFLYFGFGCDVHNISSTAVLLMRGPSLWLFGHP
jgi:hypothetical protein